MANEVLTIETAAAYVDRKISRELKRDEGREMNVDGIAVVSFTLTHRDGSDYGTFEVWIESNGKLYGEY